MPSINQIVSLLAERSGKTFDIPFQEELKVLIQVTANKFTKDSLTKRPQDRRLYLQSVVLEITHVNKIECPITYGCYLRTVEKVPLPLRSNGILFDYVGSADLEIPYANGGDWKETFFKFNRFTSRNPRIIYRDEYIFVSNVNEDMKYIGLIYVPEDSAKLKGLKCNSSENCIDDDSDWLIPGDLVEPILTSCLTKLGYVPEKRSEVKVDEKTF